jgi:hypothetical protein
MKKCTFIFLSLLISLYSKVNSANADSPQPYCMAIRGNGEAAPAHWGAMAHALELYGAPKKIAGGSSAGISAFLLQSVLLNPTLQSLSEKDRRIAAAYLVKSFQGFTEALADEPEWKNIGLLMNRNEDLPPESKKEERQSLLNWIFSREPYGSPKKIHLLTKAIRDLIGSEILSGPGTDALFSALHSFDLLHIKGDVKEIRQKLNLLKTSLAVLGDFNAKDDPALLFRDGLVNFEALGVLFGKMANFYALRESKPELIAEFAEHLNRCAPRAVGKSWRAFSSEEPECVTAYRNLRKTYAKKFRPKHPRIEDRLGDGPVPTLNSTAVVSGKAADQLRSLKRAYLKVPDPNTIETLGIRESDIRFGYWGNSADLRSIQRLFADENHAYAQIDKSKRFRSLGNTTWRTALSLSPAEPGLSSFLEMDNGDLSLGGWSDLHPNVVLKASGCEKVIYLTRKGGDTLFGQGVAKRIFGFDDISWDRLDRKDPRVQLANRQGNILDVDTNEKRATLHSRMFNLANPKSSYAYSLTQADVVFCTDWDRFDLINEPRDFNRMIEDGYTAPIYRANSSWLPLSELEVAATYLSAESVSFQERAEVAGCIPFTDLTQK